MKRWLIVIFGICWGASLHAQVDNKPAVGAFGEEIVSEEEKLKRQMDQLTGEKSASKVPHSREKSTAPQSGTTAQPKFNPNLTYSIRLIISENPLDITHKIFKQFKEKITFSQVKDIGYIYTMGSFKNKEEAIKIFNAIKAEYPAAKVITDKENPHLD